MNRQNVRRSKYTLQLLDLARALFTARSQLHPTQFENLKLERFDRELMRKQLGFVCERSNLEHIIAKNKHRFKTVYSRREEEWLATEFRANEKAPRA